MRDIVIRVFKFRRDNVPQGISLERSTVAITQDERVFFVALGAGIAQLRKDSRITHARPRQRAVMDVIEAMLAQQGR